MNKIHNIVWSKARGAWVVVAEGTKAASKAGGASLKMMTALIMLSPAAVNATTLPQGGSISVGEGTISTNSTNQMVIKQNTDKLGINWQSFNVGADGHVIFDQPGAHSIALNRVIGSDGSSILGKIDANGQVFLINPNGVIFGKDAKVNVGGLVASTLNVSDADFQAGNYKLKAGAVNGEITNLGSLNAADGGYVALIGKSVKNNGAISARLGTAALASGEAVTLDFSGDSLINIQVNASAIKALVENKGLIQADGGSVLMTARASNALLDTVVNNEGIIEAKTISNKSGKIFLDGGFEGGTVNVAGTLDASAPNSGHGGFIETSGANVSISDAVKVSTLSNAGETGEWLVDPTDFNIVAGTAAKTTNSIGASTLASSLASTNVTLATSVTSTVGHLGDLNVNADVAWSSNTKLTLAAHNDVNINAKISVNGASGGLILNPTGRVNTSSAGSVKLNGSNSNYKESNSTYVVLRTVDDLKKLGLSSASNTKFALGGDIDATVMNTWNGGLGWSPYGEYDSANTNVISSTLAGLGNTISNFYINRPGQNYVGLFGVLKDSSVSNLNLKGSVAGGDFAGMLAGQFYGGKIWNVNTSGSVSGGNKTGGVIGFANSLDSIDKLTSTASVASSGNNAGGIIGSTLSNTSVTNLHYSGSVIGKNNVGGVLGESVDAFTNNLSTTAETTVEGDLVVGGVIGNASSNGNANNIFGLGSVKGNKDVGGAIGNLMGGFGNVSATGNVTGNSSVGGLVGQMAYGYLDTTYSTSKVTATGNSVGGLVGNSTDSYIFNSFSTGRVVGGSDVGGLIGTSSYDHMATSFTTSMVSGSSNIGGFGGTTTHTEISDSYATGDVSADDQNSGGFFGSTSNTSYTNTYSTGKNNSGSLLGKGGFLGDSTGDTFTGSYWDTDKSGMNSSSGGAIGKSTAQMSQASTFSGWGISSGGSIDSNVWRIYEGNSTPLLKFLMGTADASQNNIVTTYTGSAQTPDSTGQSNLSNVQYKSFFASVLDLSAAGLNGGGFSGSPAIINAGTYDLATSALFSNQFGLNINQTSTGKLIVNKALLNFDVSANNKVYDSTTGVITSLTAHGLGSDVLTVTGYDAKFSDKNAGVGKTVNINGVTIDGAAASNYTWGALSSTANIEKATLTVTAIALDKQYDGNTSAAISFSTNQFGSDDIGIGSASKTYADKNAGVGKTVTAAGLAILGADSQNYKLASDTVTATANIDKRYLSVTAIGQDKTYDGTVNASVILADDRISGELISVSSSGATFNDKNAAGKIITVKGITVTGTDSANYTWNLSATASAVINKAALLVSATGVNKTYDGNTSAGITLSDNHFGSDVIVVSAASKSFDDKNAGAGKNITVNGIGVSGSDAGNYTWNSSAVTTADIGKANLTVTATGVNKTYDATTVASANLSDNRIGSDELVIGSGSKAFTDKNAGAGKSITVNGITVSGADAGNYAWNTSAVASADIAKASLSVTAAGGNKTYDGSRDASVTLLDNRFGSDSLIISSTDQAFSDKNAGTGKTITVNGISVNGSDAVNYTWNTSAVTTAEIGKASLVIAASGANKVYNGSTNADVTLSDNRIGSDDLVLGSTGSSFSDKNAGSGKAVSVGGISVTGTDAANYTWNGSSMTTADIAKADLNVTASGVSKTYDGTTSAVATLGDNRVNGDSLVIGGSASFADKNAGSGKSVNVAGINVSGADAGNYNWNSTASTTANVSKANLTVSASGSDKTYDGSVSAGTALTDNRLGTDDLVIGSSGSSYADKNAGDNKQITVTGINVTGSDAANYLWNSVATATGTISKAILSVIADAHDKVYDGNTRASAVLSDNRISGDQLIITSSEGSFDSKNAGVGKTVIVNGISLTGADSKNYTWNTSANASADISKASLTVNAASSGKVVGAIDGALGWSIAGGSMFGSDTMQGSLKRGPGEATGIYAIEQGSLTAGSNYTLTVVPGTFEISKPTTNVELEQTKDIISIITLTQKAATPNTKANDTGNARSEGLIEGYRLLNLGIKLPEDLIADESSKI